MANLSASHRCLHRAPEWSIVSPVWLMATCGGLSSMSVFCHESIATPFASSAATGFVPATNVAEAMDLFDVVACDLLAEQAAWSMSAVNAGAARSHLASIG